MPPNLFAVSQNSRPKINFFINGKLYEVDSLQVPIGTSLNTYLRSHAQLIGTKFMCLEGGCGACIVTATGAHPVTNELRSWAINSCLTPVYACNGLHITTVEGIGNKKVGYHTIQKRLAKFSGTQCGFCSPGMVMNMYSLLESKDGIVTQQEVENSFGGNICRCTGYRPILDAFKSLATDADPKYKELCGDIEDFPANKICPKSGEPCHGKCGEELNRLTITFDDGKEWNKVESLDALFSVLQRIGSKTYMLIAGNTAHGVYRRDENLQVFIDVNNVPELKRIDIKDNGIVFGGNVSLTDTMAALEKVSIKKGFEYCKDLWQHIDLVANVPVRNSGTLAGNLSIKHAHNEFPSDIFLIFATIDATMNIASHDGSKASFTVEEYLKLDMMRKVILDITIPSLDAEIFKFKSFKIMPRAQNAHAYVNAAFLFELNGGSVITSNICYGGIDSQFLHALKTESYLLGKDLFDSENLKQALQILENEIHAIPSPPDPSPEYRNNLAVSLFYKFVLSIYPQILLNPILRSGGETLTRAVSSGIQEFDSKKDRYPITQPIQKIEGQVQCAGEAQFVNDIPHRPGELWAAFVLSTRANAKIKSIDIAPALKVAGIHYVFTAADIPGENNFTPLNMASMAEEILASKTSDYYGQPIAIALADTFELANKAQAYVTVEYEDSEKGIYPTLKHAYENKTRCSDRFIDNAAKVDPVREGTDIKTIIQGHFEMAGQYHYTMETQTALAIPIEDGLELFSATQHMDFVQAAVSRCLKIPECSINMQVRRVGGAYGSKISRCSQVACAAAIGALLSNRPCRLVLSIESNMAAIGKRFGLINDYEVAVDDKGAIQKLTNLFVQDYGRDLCEDIIGGTMIWSSNCYDQSTHKITAQSVITNSAANTWCRSPGSTEALAMIENIMEHVAYATGLDPIDVRLANIPDDSDVKNLIPEFIENVEFRMRKSEIDEFNRANRWKKRGIAFVPMRYPQMFMGPIPVVVTIYHSDGTVNVLHGGIEMGQGLNTKVVQVVAHTLGIPIENIRVKPSLNYIAANSQVTGGSYTSEAVSFGALKACEVLMDRMEVVRKEMKNATWAEIAEACYSKGIELSATHYYRAEELPTYDVWGLSCAEIEVDVLTGSYQLRRVDILEDTGESISPWIDVGQVEGAFIMGMGYWLNENLVYDNRSGELLTNRTWNYKPPGAKDIPIDFRIKFIRDRPNPASVLRSKATGEPALCMAVVVVFALRYALLSARKDAGLKDEWIELGAPTTPEHAFLKAGVRSEQFFV